MRLPMGIGGVVRPMMALDGMAWNIIVLSYIPVTVVAPMVSTSAALVKKRL